MRSPIRGAMRPSDAAARVVGLVLLVLISAHVAYLPVLAFEDHDVTASSNARQDGGPAAKRWPPTLYPQSSDHGDGGSHLAEHGDRDAECMAGTATLSMRSSTPDALRRPAGIPNAAEADSFAPTTGVISPAELTRRHLLLQVLLR